MSERKGEIQQKILLLLLGGVALGLSGNPRRFFRILGKIRKEWKDIDEQKIRRSIRALYESKLVKEVKNKDGTITLFLTKKGKKKALTYNLNEMEIKSTIRWDGKWRIVLFDIPEKIKGKREIIRAHLKRLKFFEFQKSVFIHPYDCCNEIEYLVEAYELRKYARFMVATELDNELHLRKHFELL